MNQKPDAGDDQKPDAREGVDQIGQVDRQIAAEDPLVRHDFVRGAGAQDIREHADDAEERESHRSPGETMGDLMGVPAAKEPIGNDGQQGEHRNQFYEQIS